MILGICIGIAFMVWTILAFAVGYGWDKANNNSTEE